MKKLKQWRLVVSSFGDRNGAALVIILAFVVLLAGLTLAFFSRAMSDRQVSNSGAIQIKTQLFAQGAADSIVGDLKQEIAAGSIATNTAPVSGVKIYTPTAPLAQIPSLVGSTGTGGMENLVKRSVYNSPFFPSTATYDTSTYPPSQRAAGPIAESSTTIASQDGRSVSRARWNLPLLLSKQNAGPANDTDLTPVSSYTAPDWVLVARDGSNPKTWNANLIGSSTMAVTGRYAYNIYDEGGILDANVAGYPTGMTSAQIGYKTSTALANLRLLPGIRDLSASDQNTVLNSIVGWRNYASSQPTGSFPFSATSFDANAAKRYFDALLINTKGFMTAANPTLFNGQSDRTFSSRQELIKFMLQGLGSPTSATATAIAKRSNLQNALQYLTTFSRALEQPSFVPNPSRPKVVGTAGPPAVSSVNSYQGNNTYFGSESPFNIVGSITAPTGFLTIRVSTPFTRLDGTSATAGEPLMKRKFALSNLSRITNTATATTSATDPIYARFGLSRSDSTKPWVYNHGTAGTIIGIRTVPSKGREPDFAEVLKAAINVGSVGKAGPSGQASNDQYRIDASGDIQILQIMANLIDQQKTDNYPTWIQFVDGNNVTRNIYGTQDLPYFYRWHYFAVTTELPDPLLSKDDKVMFTTPSAATVNHMRAKGGVTLRPGKASYMIIPQIWNPHDANTPVASAGGPTAFRVIAETTDPTKTKGYWGMVAIPLNGGQSLHFDGAPFGFENANPVPTTVSSTPNIMNGTSSYVQFTDTSAGKAFREPTLLWRDGYPSGVSLAGTSVTEVTELTGNRYFGIFIGETPISWTANINSTDYICQSSALQRAAGVAGPSGSETDNITFRMQYLRPGGSATVQTDWITYQDSYSEDTLTYIPTHTLFVNKADYVGDNKYANPLMGGITNGGPNLTAPEGGPYDPRSQRFSAPVSGEYTSDDPALNGNPSLEIPTLVANGQPSAAQNAAVGTSNFVLMATQRPSTSRGQLNYFLVPNNGPYNALARWYSSSNWKDIGKGPTDANFYDGLLSQNNPAVQLLGGNADNGTNATIRKEYYEDADGVARRAMGGYVPASGTVTSGTASGRRTNTSVLTGLPMATSAALDSVTGLSVSPTGKPGIIIPSVQSQSRAIVLHRPFRSVGEMSYAFRGTPWKNIDFFTPESGDTALLDVFCVNEAPSDALVAGKVNLNTKQAPVIQAMLEGSYRDEWASSTTPPTNGARPAISSTEAKNLADTLLGLTSGAQPWQGPLTNVADIVGHYVPNAGTVTGSDVYQYTSPSTNTTYTYAGFTAALSGTTPSGTAIWDPLPVPPPLPTLSEVTQYIQRFREAAIRPLVDGGQTRVWNLLIDVIGQTGRYPSAATSVKNFIVEGEKRFWVHVAIDRNTGEVIDRQFEAVTE